MRKIRKLKSIAKVQKNNANACFWQENEGNRKEKGVKGKWAKGKELDIGIENVEKEEMDFVDVKSSSRNHVLSLFCWFSSSVVFNEKSVIWLRWAERVGKEKDDFKSELSELSQKKNPKLSFLLSSIIEASNVIPFPPPPRSPFITTYHRVLIFVSANTLLLKPLRSISPSFTKCLQISMTLTKSPHFTFSSNSLISHLQILWPFQLEVYLVSLVWGREEDWIRYSWRDPVQVTIPFLVMIRSRRKRMREQIRKEREREEKCEIATREKGKKQPSVWYDGIILCLHPPGNRYLESGSRTFSRTGEASKKCSSKKRLKIETC